MSDEQRDYVTVVSGLPRSGTSMMMRMLDRGGIEAVTDNIRAADEDNPKGYYEFEAVKRTKQDASWVQSAVGKSVKLVYALLYELPADFKYRVLFMNRKLEEVLASQDVMLERRGKSQGKLSHEELKANFEKQLQKVHSWLSGQPNFAVLEVDYNKVLSEASPVVEQVDAFLDGGLDTAAMLEVVDPSLYRRRK